MTDRTADRAQARRISRGCALLITQDGILYKSQGNQILRSDNEGVSWTLDCYIAFRSWKDVCATMTAGRRALRWSVSALRVLADGSRVAVAKDGIYRAAPGAVRMQRVQSFGGASRPLGMGLDSRGRLCYGDYYSGRSSAGVDKHVYMSDDGGVHFHVVATFASNDIRHVHNVLFDSYLNVWWLLVGDFDAQPGIGVLEPETGKVEWVVRGCQQARTVGAIVTEDELLFGTDSELEPNLIMRLAKSSGCLSVVEPSPGPSLYACRMAGFNWISTDVEPLQYTEQRLSAALLTSCDSGTFTVAGTWKKDRLDCVLFGFGTVVLPVVEGRGDGGPCMLSGHGLTGLDGVVVAGHDAVAVIGSSSELGIQ